MGGRMLRNTQVSSGRKIKDGRYQKHVVSGLLMHASLAITPEGLPLGPTAAKFLSRSKFKGTRALKRKINPTRVPIQQKESMRWLDKLRLPTELASAPEGVVTLNRRLFKLARPSLIKRHVPRISTPRMVSGTTAGGYGEGITGCGMHIEEALQSTWRSEALHYSLPFSERQMAVFCSVIESLVGPMISAGSRLTFGGAIGAQFVRNDPFWHEAAMFH
jgi:hypothetical protein